jgi:hypothetical protein
MTSPDDTRPVLAIDHIVHAMPANAAMAVRNNHHDATDNKNVDAPSGAQHTTAAHDMTKKMVWAGYMRTQVVPTHLCGAPDQCLVYRRVVKDLDDNNKILDDMTPTPSCICPSTLRASYAMTLARWKSRSFIVIIHNTM